jgi:hypothetical protein
MENQVRGKVFGLQFGYPSCALSKQKTEEKLWTVCLARATTSPSRLRVVRITSGTELSRHFRMPRSATLNIIAGQAATCHEQSSASRCRRHRHRASPSPKIFADMKVLDSGRPAESSDYSRMVRPEAMGQAASARRDAARHADRHFADATVIRDCHATGLQDARFFLLRPPCSARGSDCASSNGFRIDSSSLSSTRCSSCPASVSFSEPCLSD